MGDVRHVMPRVPSVSAKRLLERDHTELIGGKTLRPLWILSGFRLIGFEHFGMNEPALPIGLGETMQQFNPTRMQCLE